ncbi:uncharacterized protein LOC144659260 isoform X2 [Oculina patagonica]
MADGDERLLYVRLDDKYEFVVLFPVTKTIEELRPEIACVAREVFPEFRGDQVLSVHNKKGLRLPDRYQVGKVLQNQSEIICYSSDNERSKEASKEKPLKKQTRDISNSKTTNSSLGLEESSSSVSIRDSEGPVLGEQGKGKRYKVQQRSRKNNKRIEGGKENENVKKLSQTDKPRPAMADKVAVARDGKEDERQNATTTQGNTFLTHFVADMQELQNEGSQDESECLQKSLEKTQSGAFGVEDDLCHSLDLNKRSHQVQKTAETVRNKSKAVNTLTKRTQQETKDTGNHIRRSSSEAILSASKYHSLFSSPEHCRPKRKEAIETSASKVAEWLCTNDVASNGDVGDTHSDEGTMDLYSEFEEGQPKEVVGKGSPAVENYAEAEMDNNDEEEDVAEDDDNDNDGDGSHDEDEDSDINNVSVVKSVNNVQAFSNKTSCYTRKDVGIITDAFVSPSPCKSKRNAGGSVGEENEALRSSHNTEANQVCTVPRSLPSRGNNTESRLTKKSALLSAASTCQVKIRKLNLCIKHGRNVKVEYTSGHQMNKGPLQGNDIINTVNNGDDRQRKGKEGDGAVLQVDVLPPSKKTTNIQKTKNTLSEDNCCENTAKRQEGDIIKNHLDSKDRVDSGASRDAVIQKKGDLQMSAEKSSSDEQDVHVENSVGVHRTQCLNEKTTTKSDDDDDDDDYDDDNDDEDVDYEDDDKITPDVSKNNTVTVDHGNDEDSEFSGPVGGTVLSVDCRAKDDLKTEVPEQEEDVNKRKQLERGTGCKENIEISQKAKETPRRDTNSIEETSESGIQDIDMQSVKQVSDVEKDVASGTEDEKEENNNLTPVYLTPIKEGEQITWLKETSRGTDSEQVRDDYEDFMNRLQVSDCKSTPCKSKRSRRENSPLLSSETAKESEDDDEKSPDDVKLQKNGRRKRTKTKRKSERKKRKLEGNKDPLVKNGNHESVCDRTVSSTKTMEENVELEYASHDPTEKTSEQQKRKLKGNEDTLVENVSQENVSDRTTTSKKTLKENVEHEHVSQDPTKKMSEQKRRRLEGCIDALVRKVNHENDSNRTTTPKKSLPENLKLRVTSQEPIEKRSEQEKKILKGDGNVLVENDTQECVSDRTVTKKSEETPKKIADKEGYSEDERNDDDEKSNERKTSNQVEIVNNMGDHVQDENQISQSKKDKRKKKEKRRKRELSNTESAVEIPLTSPSVEGDSFYDIGCSENTRNEARQNKHVELETATQDTGENKNTSKTLKNKADEGLNCDLLQKTEREAFIGEETAKKQAGKDSYGEDECSETSNGRKTSNQVEELNDISGQLQVEKFDNQVEMLKKSKEKKKEKRRKTESSNMDKATETAPTSPSFEKVTLESKADDELNSDVLKKLESEASIGEKKTMKKTGNDSYCEDEGRENDEKSNDRKRNNEVEEGIDISGHLQEGNIVSQIEMPKKSKKKKKEKRRKSELSNIESATETAPTSPRVKRVALKRKADDELSCDLLQKLESEPSTGEKKTKKKTGKDSKDEQSEKDEKSNNRKSINQLEEVNEIRGQLQEGNGDNQVEMLKKSRKKKKEKRRKSELSNIERTIETTPTSPRVALKRKADEELSCDLLQKLESEPSIGEKTSKKKAGKDSCCEDKRSEEDEKSNDRESSNQIEGVNENSGQLQEGNLDNQVKMLKDSKKKKKEKRRKSESRNVAESTIESTPTSSVKRVALKRKADEELSCHLPSKKRESEPSIGEKTPKKKAGKDSYCEDEQNKDEKSNDRESSNQIEGVNDISGTLQEGNSVNQSKKSRKKKEKRRKSDTSNRESANERCASPTLEKLDSPNDSGYSENSRNHPKQSEKGFGSNDPEHPKSTGNKKISKPSLSLLDLALDDTANQGDSKTSHKKISSKGRPAHQLARHFRQTPKGFLHTTKNRRIPASAPAVIVRRKPRTNSKEIPKHAEKAPKGKDLVTSRFSFEQLLDDESLWNT